MAKKKFDIKSTISVQPKTFSVDDVESAVKKIHDASPQAPEKEKTETAAQKATPKPKAQRATKPAQESKPAPPRRRGRPKSPEAPIRKVRLSVDVSPETHKRLKIKAIEHDSDIMHYVEMLIEKDLGSK
jgi:hypothetical protein